MGIFRDRETRQFAVVFTAVVVTAATAGSAIQPAAGILALTSAAALSTVFLVFTKARYKSIAKLSEQIDLVLRNSDHLFIGGVNGGGLSILQSKMAKITLRIQEQDDALKRKKEHLAESVTDTAHQLRTPLTSVNLILSLLEDSPDGKERGAMIREIKELFIQMDWLLASLLKLPRLDADIVVFQGKRIGVHNLISSVLHSFLISMDLHSITLRTDVPKKIFIQGDPGWLSETIQDILRNCLGSAGDDGKTVIACEDNPLSTEITIRGSGAGFVEKDLPHLFDRFYRGKHTGATGYEIRPTLCKTITTRQGGTITAENHPQGGAVFSTRFPK